jgi:hypothetical protein
LIELNKWHELIMADSKFVSLMPFLWIDGNGSTAGPHSAESLPWIRERLYQIASSIYSSDVLAYPVEVAASSSTDPYWPFGAFSGLGGSSAISNFAPQSIIAYLVDPSLGAVGQGGTHVSSIQLTTWQDVFSSPTTHILLGQDALTGAWNVLATWSGNTVDGQRLVWSGDADLRAIKVETTQSPSWVGWRDIRVFRSASACQQPIVRTNFSVWSIFRQSLLESAKRRSGRVP